MRKLGLLTIASLILWAAPGAADIVLSYMGAFEVNRTYAGHAGLAYCPDGDGGNGSVFVVSTGGGVYVREFPIPALTDPRTRVDELANFAPNCGADGLSYLPAKGGQTSGKLYWSKNSSGPQAQNLGFGDVDGSNQSGPWWNGGSRVGEGLFGAPQAWADTNTDGRSLLSVGDRYGDPGPRLRAVAPWEWTWTEDPGQPGWDTTAQASTLLLEYEGGTEPHPLILPGGAGEGSSTDDYYYGAYLTVGSESAVLIGGKPTALGSNVILFYDPQDLAEVAQGAKQPYEPQPYKMLDLSPYLAYGNTCGGGAYDASSNVLYISEYHGGGDDRPVIHVFDVVPEPSSAVLLLCAGLGLLRRRARK